MKITMRIIMVGALLMVAAAPIAALALLGVPLLNLTIGPSKNTIMGCRELQKDGYLEDKCFDKDEYGHERWNLKCEE